MERRAFIAGTLSLLAAPLAAEAQQPAQLPRVGIIWLASRAEVSRLHEAFVQGLRDVGYIEGRNITVEVRAADGRMDQLPMLATELVRAKVDVIVAPSTPAAKAAKAATENVPIVIANVIDPVALRLVASLARPGSNVTGLSNLSTDLSGKHLDLLKEALPELTRVTALWSPSTARFYRTEMESAARALGLSMQAVDVQSIEDVEKEIGLASRSKGGAILLVGAGGGNAPFLPRYRRRIAEAALRYRLPTMSGAAPWVEAGGFMSYGPDNLHIYHRAAILGEKVLKVGKPAGLPVEQPT